jgi:predicted RNA-binding protein YlqC (UPF0109 family)
LLSIKDLVAYIAKALVDKPEDVVVTEIEAITAFEKPKFL